MVNIAEIRSMGRLTFIKNGLDITEDLLNINGKLLWMTYDEEHVKWVIIWHHIRDIKEEEILKLMEEGYRFIEFRLCNGKQGVVMEVD